MNDLLIATNDDGDKLFQEGATVDPLGLNDTEQTRPLITPMPFGYVLYANGQRRQMRNIDNMLKTGFWTIVADVVRTETLLTEK